MLLAATHADDRIGEDWGKPKPFGPIDDLHGILSIDERFRDNEARPQGTHSRL